MVELPYAAGDDAEPGGSRPGSPRRALLGAGIGVVVVALVAALVVWWSPWRSSTAGQPAELWLEPAASTGPDPFTGSTDAGLATTSTTSTTAVPPPPASTTTVATTASTVGGGTRTLGGSTPGLYGGSGQTAACDVEAQIAFLASEPAKAAAFAGVLGIAPIDIPDYLRSLRPVVLTEDTRVTNHGYVDGVATPRQAVLEAGTAVLIDRYGIPRVRCRCGNPLLPPLRLDEGWDYRGDGWEGFHLDQTVVIDIDIEIDILILVDLDGGGWWEWPWDDDPYATTTTTVPGGSSTTTPTTGPPPTGTGWRCADTPEGAWARLVAARLAGDRTTASMCAGPPVLDWLWSLTDGAVEGLGGASCVAPGPYYPDAAYLCTVGDGTQLYIAAPGGVRANGFIVVMLVGDGGGWPTTEPTTEPTTPPPPPPTVTATTTTTPPTTGDEASTVERVARGLFRAWQDNALTVAEHYATQQAAEALFALGDRSDAFSPDPSCNRQSTGEWYCSFPGVPPQAGAIYMRVDPVGEGWLVGEAFFGGGV